MANTDPHHWFLSAAELPTSRTPAYTSNNKVEALIDGKAYMEHLYNRMFLMAQGDYFHLSGWRVTPTQKLLGATSPEPDFLTQLKDLIQHQITVRVMLWYFPVSVFGVAPNHPGENIDFVKEIIGAGGQGVLDERFRLGVFSAHHQKAIVLRSDGVDWAYVGGIDVCSDRWDTPTHDNPPARTKEFFEGWHDVHTAMQGPAVAQVWANFQDRWNDPTKPHTYSLAPGGDVPKPITEPKPNPLGTGTHHVQVLRTLACKKPAYPFAVLGEQTVRLAYERAIEQAEHYIYIEDQYLWPSTLTAKLADAAKRGVKIIFVMAHNYDFPGLIYYHNTLRNDVLTAIQRGLGSGPASGVYPFHLQQPALGSDIYVHAKLMIVDDCFAAIGSANVNRRSHTNDSELHLAIVDDDTVQSTMDGQSVTVCRFAKQLRLALWMEHLGLVSPNLIEDPIAGLLWWPDWTLSTPGSPSHRHHVVCHYVPTPQFRRPPFVSEQFMNVLSPSPC